MVAMSFLTLSAILVVGAEGYRTKRGGMDLSSRSSQKMIMGVPMLNYDRAYEGEQEMTLEGRSQNMQDAVKVGEWVIMMNPSTTDAQIADICNGGKYMCKAAGNPSKGGIPFMEVRGTESDLEDIIRQAPGMVKYVEPDARVSMIPEKLDTMQGGARTWGLKRIGADKQASQGAGVTVYVLDTGVRTTHMEFGKRAASAADATPLPKEDCNNMSSCAYDAQGHGTHCAGTVGGATFGVAPQASIRAIKVLDDDGSGQWHFTYWGLDWVAVKGARPAVASLSLGGAGQFSAMDDAVNRAVSAGVTVVVAAGNENSNACHFSPAFCPNAIAVGSINKANQRSFFSNYGECVNIWAPGSDIRSAMHTDDQGHKELSGTSMACPHVAGAAACLLESDPTMQPDAVLRRLLADAEMKSIKMLKIEDTNALLYVGSDAPPPPGNVEPPKPTPPPPPTPAPEPCNDPEHSEGPDSYGDCKCRSDLICWWEKTPGNWLKYCPYSQTNNTDHYSTIYYSNQCKDCECWGWV